MKMQYSAHESPLPGNFDALAPSEAAKFPSIQWSQASASILLNRRHQ
jgi:hypothetical protein